MGKRKTSKSNGEHHPKWTAKSHRELSEFFGVSISTIKNWVNRAESMASTDRVENPFEKVGETYNVAAVYAWLCVYKERAALSRLPAVEDDDSFTVREREAKLSKVDISNELGMIDLRERRQELVSRQAVKEEVTRFVHAIRRRLELIPEQLGTYIPGPQRAVVISEVDAQMRSILHELAHLKREAGEVE